MINVEINKSKTETNPSALRRFSKRVQESGILARARRIQYRSKVLSEANKKRKRLKYLRRLEKIERLIKLGKLPDRRSITMK